MNPDNQGCTLVARPDAAAVRGAGVGVGDPMSTPELHPAESMALTVALAQVRRGDDPEANVTAMCVYALARLTGRFDWTAGAK
jgi:hypothetical protein